MWPVPGAWADDVTVESLLEEATVKKYIKFESAWFTWFGSW